MQYTTLGPAGPPVSLLGMGSYETLCYMEYRDIVNLVQEAVDLGITLFDVAHYSRAPHTEVVLSRALDDVGVSRDDYQLVTKVWGREDTSMKEQLDANLFRLGFDHVDGVLCYGPRWDIGDPATQARNAASLVTSGRARWWGGLNWSAADLNTAMDAIAEDGGPAPVLMQMKYNFARRTLVEGEDYMDIWRNRGISLQASDTLEGGLLAGREESKRVLGRDPGSIRNLLKDRLPLVREIADEFDVSLAELAIIYAASFEYTSSVLAGSSRIEQLQQNARAINKAATIGEQVRKRLNEIKIEGHRLDVPPNTVVKAEDDPYKVSESEQLV